MAVLVSVPGVVWRFAMLRIWCASWSKRWRTCLGGPRDDTHGAAGEGGPRSRATAAAGIPTEAEADGSTLATPQFRTRRDEGSVVPRSEWATPRVRFVAIPLRR
jgi:hypothetical protein